MNQNAQHDLEHFLKLSLSQLRHRLREMEKKEKYSESIARMRLLEELLKEQIPNENASHSTCASR